MTQTQQKKVFSPSVEKKVKEINQNINQIKAKYENQKIYGSVLQNLLNVQKGGKDAGFLFSVTEDQQKLKFLLSMKKNVKLMEEFNSCFYFLTMPKKKLIRANK